MFNTQFQVRTPKRDAMMDITAEVADALKSMKNLDTRTFVVDKRHADDEYGVVMFRDIANEAGWDLAGVWTDKGNLFAVTGLAL